MLGTRTVKFELKVCCPNPHTHLPQQKQETLRHRHYKTAKPSQKTRRMKNFNRIQSEVQVYQRNYIAASHHCDVSRAQKSLKPMYLERKDFIQSTEIEVFKSHFKVKLPSGTHNENEKKEGPPHEM